MELNEAIKHARDVAENRTDLCEECRAEHRQLAEWLEQLKKLTEENEEWRKSWADNQAMWDEAYEKLELTLEGVMHFVDKWLEGAELELDEVNRAITMREKTLKIVEKLTEENERLRDELDRTEKALIVTDKAHNALFTESFRIEAEARADTVRKMHSEIKDRCIKGGIYPVFVARTIDQIAKEMLEEG